MDQLNGFDLADHSSLRMDIELKNIRSVDSGIMFDPVSCPRSLPISIGYCPSQEGEMIVENEGIRSDFI
jgi:hypothetical protein